MQMTRGFVLVIAVALATSAWAEKIKDCKVSFKTKGEPVLVTIEGKSETKCEGSFTVEGNEVKEANITLSLLNLDTGIPLRNKHLRENYLHTDKFPTAKLSDVKPENLAAQLAGSASGESPFKATLELHGEKKPIEGKYVIKGNQYSSNFEIDLPIFGVERPSFMGVRIVDKVHVEVKFKTEK